MDTVKILILEDNENDMELIKSEIVSALKYPFQFDWVLSKNDFIRSLNEIVPDIVISDYNLPQFNGLDALKLCKNFDPLLPFIIVTGSISEEAAADSIKSGAWDYVVKERLHRLPTAIENVLKLKKERLRARKIEAELNLVKLKTDLQLKLLWNAINKAPSSIVITSEEGIIQFVNPQFEKTTGYTADEAIGQSINALKSGVNDPILAQKYRDILFREKSWRGELVGKKKNGELYWEEVYMSLVFNDEGNVQYLISIEHDISKKKESEEALTKSENWYKAIFGNTGTATCILNHNRTISLVNSKFEELSGFLKEEIEGKKKWFEFVAEEDLQRMSEYFNKRRESGYNIPQQYEFTFVRPDGGRRNIFLTIDSIPGTTEFVASLLDITDRKKMEEELKSSEEKFRLISASAQDGIILINNLGEIIYWNPAAEKIFGYSFAEVLNKKLHPLIMVPKYFDQHVKAFSQFTKSGAGDAIGKITELEGRKKDGSIINIELSLAGMQLPNGFGAVGIVRDITERKRAEAELIAAKERAEESDRLKSAFLATMSHELRTPLNAIMGFSRLINKELPLSEIEEMAELIYQGGSKLLKVVESVFDVAILQAKGLALTISEFPILDLFDGLRQHLNAEITKEGKQHVKTSFLHPENSDRVSIKTDRVRLTQLLVNLISNAVKFTESGKIDVGFSMTGQDITFFIRDTGIGIPKDKTAIIFEQFRQVDDAHTRKYEGVGLGLTICKEIATMLGGSLHVETELGQGSIFYFTLPGSVIFTDNITTDKKEEPSINLSGKTILIAEDIESNYILIELMLKPTGVKLLWAQNGEQAISFVKEQPDIDFILMDMRMPGIDGYLATREIKLMRPDMPVIAQTAYALANEKQKIFEAGCDDYISKPFSRQTLIDVIRKYSKK